MIESLRLQNFRCYKDFSIALKPGINIITGANGSGKTTLIEAIAIATSGKSWRSNFDSVLAKNSSDNWWRVDVKLSDEDLPRTVKFIAKTEQISAQKTFTVNDKIFSRLPKTAKKPLLLFEPGDLQLFYGSPSRRREFFDRFIGEIEPRFTTVKNKFDRVLRQRNKLLKSGVSTADDLFIWNVQFAELSSEISKKRAEMINQINQNLQEYYHEISGLGDVVSVKFAPNILASKNAILAKISDDKFITSVGAQKDDFKFLLNSKPTKTSASRGENRTLLFAIFAQQINLLREKHPEIVVLFDDIDGELDRKHRQNLYNTKIFRENNLIATTIDFSGGAENHIHL